MQETSGTYTATLVDEAGTAIPAASLNVMQLTVFDGKSGTVLRTTQDALNANNVTVSSGGLVTWTISPFETQVVSSNLPFGSVENHWAVFECLYNASQSFPATSFTFSSTLGSSSVGVLKTSHGLSINDHVAFVDADPIGGLELDGLMIVTAVADVDNFTLKHKSTATATGSQSQTVDAYFGGTAAKHAYQFSVKKVDVI